MAKKAQVTSSGTKAAKVAGKGAGASPSVELIPVIDKRAMQKDIGIKVISALSQSVADTEKAQQLTRAANERAFDAQSQLTMAIVKLATIDKSIDLSTAFDAENKKGYTHLTNQIGLALGYREVYTIKDKQTVAYSKAVFAHFPAPGDDADDPETKRKQSNRSNFLHRLKQCVQAADGIIAKGTKAEIDKKAGTLRLTGPAVKEQFGHNTVLLDGKQKIEDGKGNEVELKVRPSFTAIATQAGEAHGMVGRQRTDTGGTRGVAVDPNKAVESLCKSLVAALEKVKNVTDTMRQQLATVANAITVKIEQAK